MYKVINKNVKRYTVFHAHAIISTFLSLIYIYTHVKQYSDSCQKQEKYNKVDIVKLTR